jgi:hypothetical protein
MHIYKHFQTHSIILIIIIIVVELQLSGRWLSGSPIIRNGLAPRLNIFLTVIALLIFMA